MSTLKTKIGEIELVDGSDEEIEYKMLADLINLWQVEPENIDEKAMANYFKPVSAECFVNLVNCYRLNEYDFASYAVVRSLAEHFNVDAGDCQVLSALWWKAFIYEYGVGITKLIANEVSTKSVDLHPYVV